MSYLHVVMRSASGGYPLMLLLFITLVSVSHAQDKYQQSLAEEAGSVANRQLPDTTGHPRVAKSSGPDDYLGGLAAEAGATEVDQASHVSTDNLQDKHQQPDKINWDINNQRLGTLISELKPAQFEKALQTNFFASYVFYQKLDTTSKHLIYKEYLKKPDIRYLRKRIIALSK